MSKIGLYKANNGVDELEIVHDISRQVFTIDGRRFSNMKGFYQELEAVFTDGLGWHIGGGFGHHEYGEPIHIRWISYDKSIRNLGKETMDEIEEIILDTDNSGHDCTLEKL